ncbi:tektin-2 [Oryzias latipes]|uniref:Tektin n=1 Tax=Oryzias latipes TaxID=8090 RepID=H2LYW8_ORYLA|nr:tektin-2 [Oryzias latipes]
MLPVKPSLRCGVSEWNNNNLQLWAEAQQQRLVSSEIRQECKSLRNETHCKTVWDEKETSRRLTERVWDVSRWRDLLDSCAQKVDEEMDALTLSKELTEQALAATATPLEVSTECMMLREGRRGYELVTDPVQEQLQKEVELIERVQQTLQQHIDEAFQQLCVLQEARHQLTGDLQNKMEALDIDKSCLTLTITSPNISLKTNPTRIPSGASTPQEWVQLSNHNVVQAEEAMRVSQQMREDMSLSRAQLQNELEAERRATEFALRKRSHHEEQARDELQWQIRNMEAEIAEMESDIRELDADLQAKTAPLKLAHTRLENRTHRPGMDLCRDEVQYSLVAEVEQLEATVLALQLKLSKAQHSLQNMRLHHGQMLQDLSRKQEALSLEQRSLNTRTRLTSGSSTVGVVAPVVPLMNSCGRGNLQLMAE